MGFFYEKETFAREAFPQQLCRNRTCNSNIQECLVNFVDYHFIKNVDLNTYFQDYRQFLFIFFLLSKIREISKTLKWPNSNELMKISNNLCLALKTAKFNSPYWKKLMQSANNAPDKILADILVGLSVLVQYQSS